MTKHFDKAAYKARLRDKLENSRKVREKRFQRIAVPSLLAAFALFLFLTPYGRQILGDLRWAAKSENWLLHWFFAYCVVGVLLTFIIDWAFIQFIRRKKND
ncbi:hypothetical protein [Robiginitomaculum antarcticum]|uniref:hypothetical protein n=1 Tax=Robiginitomaculum antarcticum TaxID=437507 RepID=UPI00037130AE|nr:hypothetical protein [Robiginitomaculum antarcticum]